MEIYPPANDICQDAVFLFKDRPELIRWVYGEAWETSLVNVWVLTSFGVWQIDLSWHNYYYGITLLGSIGDRYSSGVILLRKELSDR